MADGENSDSIPHVAPGRGADRFLAHLSHELRTPLGGVLGMAGLLAGTELNPEQAAYVQAIRDCGEHLLGLVNNVLDLAKLESGKPDLAAGPVDLARLMQGVTELLSPRAHAKGIEIAWAAQGALPIVQADEARLRQVLFNLAGNAVKFTQVGGVLITASASPAGDGQVTVRLSVCDTGPGIEPDAQAGIFKPFVQAHAGAASGEDSTGLGLAIVDRLATAMGAEIALDSIVGQGSTFSFTLTAPVAQASGCDGALAGMVVAVVSPSAVVRAAARLQVQAAGGTAQGYASLEAAAKAPREAVMLVDDTLRTRRRRLEAPVDRTSIILLPAERRSRIAPSRRAGFAGYLIKPLRAASLVERVRAVRADLPQRSSGPMADERARPASGARVLLAEDNPVNAMLARALLLREGCDCSNAANGPEALELALSGDFDLILMDLRLPGMGGLDVTRRLRAEGVVTPVVALTADGFEEDRRACFDAGMDDFLVKPLDPDTLRALLGRLKSGAFTEPAPEARLAS